MDQKFRTEIQSYIARVPLSRRAKNALRKLGVKSNEELKNLDLMQVWNLRNCGEKTTQEIDAYQRGLNGHLIKDDLKPL